MKSLMLVTADFPPFAGGGVARYSKDIYEGLKKTNNNPVLITCSPKKSYKFKDKNIYCLYNRFYYNKALKYIWFNIISLGLKKKVFETKKCSLIHSLSSCQSDVGFSRLITKNFFISILNTFSQVTKSNVGISKKDKFFRLIFNTFMKLNEHLISKISKRVITISEGTKNAIIKDYNISNNKIKVIPLFINKKHFYSSQKKHHHEKDYIMTVGRLVPRKGFEYLIESFNQVSKIDNKIKLIIVGDSGDKDYETLLVKKIEEYKLNNRVVIRKNVSDSELSELYKYSRFFVFTSQVEGFGLVLLDSMSFGKPIIAFNIPAVKELIKDNYNGYLVPNKNVDLLAKRILSLNKDEDNIKELGSNSLKFSERYSEKRTIKLLLREYEKN